MTLERTNDDLAKGTEDDAEENGTMALLIQKLNSRDWHNMISLHNSHCPCRHTLTYDTRERTTLKEACPGEILIHKD